MSNPETPAGASANRLFQRGDHSRGRLRPARLLAALLLFGQTALASPATDATPRSPVVVDDFEDGLSPCWEEKVFSKRTSYRIVRDRGGALLRAESRGAASGLVCRVEFDPRELPMLSWRWKVANILEGGDGRVRSGDDYAARVYVVFPHWFPPKTRVLNYIWANRLPRGEMLPSPFLARNIMFAVRSGADQVGIWVDERRDLMADFRRAFGVDPPAVGAIAVMTDTDQTGESAVAYYDDFRLQPRTAP